MARYDYNYSCNGCGTGSTCNVMIIRDGVTVRSESYQFACTVTEQVKRDAIISIVPYASTDTAFVNGVQIWPVAKTSSGSSLLLLAGALIAAMLLFGKKGK